MLKSTIISLLATTAVFMASPPNVSVEAATPASQTASEVKASGRHEINGVNYYYEIRGKGEPLLLLHGGLGSIDMFAPVLPMMTEGRTVIAVDLQGHGRTPLGDRSIDVSDIGADMATLVKALGYKQVDVIGYSFGAWTGLHMAAQSPDTVRRLVLVSMPFEREGFFAEMLPQQSGLTGAAADYMKDTPMYQSYVAVAPDPKEFPKLLDEMGRLMRNPYDYSSAVEKLSMPVMLIYGDSDMIRPEHVVEFYQKLGGGLKDAGWNREHMARNRLAILPDLTHYETFMSPEVFRQALIFVDGKGSHQTWADAIETR